MPAFQRQPAGRNCGGFMAQKHKDRIGHICHCNGPTNPGLEYKHRFQAETWTICICRLPGLSLVFLPDTISYFSQTQSVQPGTSETFVFSKTTAENGLASSGFTFTF